MSALPDVQTRLDAYWTHRAAAYDAYQQRPERRDLDRAVWGAVWSGALGTDPLDVLDLGTGSGHVACLLASLGHRVTGIDLSEGMLAEARRHATTLTSPPDLRRGDMVDPPLPAGSLDAVVGRFVAWTLRSPAQAAAAWHRLLRPGGRLALVDTAWFPDGLDAPGERWPEVFREVYDARTLAELPLAEGDTVGALVDLLGSVGFHDVTTEPLLAVRELDLAHGVAPGHEVRTLHLVTARA